MKVVVVERGGIGKRGANVNTCFLFVVAVSLGRVCFFCPGIVGRRRGALDGQRV